jgi:hypothetical protein
MGQGSRVAAMAAGAVQVLHFPAFSKPAHRSASGIERRQKRQRAVATDLKQRRSALAPAMHDLLVPVLADALRTAWSETGLGEPSLLAAQNSVQLGQTNGRRNAARLGTGNERGRQLGRPLCGETSARCHPATNWGRRTVNRFTLLRLRFWYLDWRRHYFPQPQGSISA